MPASAKQRQRARRAGGAKDAITGAKDANTGAKDAITGAQDAITGAKDAITGAKDAITGAKDATTGAKDPTPAATDADAAFMRRVLELAEQQRGRTAPNPIVGCVIVDTRGTVIAEGVHRGPGTKHAEIDALDQLGGKAPGATLYVNLEPCTHHGRTPPCVPAVKAAGLARVVIGSEDPVPGHGGGLATLRRAGVRVARALVDECDEANRPFRTWAVFGRPAFTLKAAMTLDGKIATVAGQSQWITGELARGYAHHLRDTHDAVLVGVGTVLADDPRLSSRIAGARDAMRVVLDSRLRTPADARLLPGKRGPRTIIATTDAASVTKERALVAAGAEVWRFKARAGRVPLDRVAHALGEKAAMTSVLVEGGGEVHAAFLRQGCADQLVLFVAPKAVGGPAPSWLGGKGISTLASAYGFRFAGEPAFVGGDLMLRLVRQPDALARR
jgi:diaminohydroxyphosphoribosylaminopyrimidine deaminase / 5-amino-6-(5-phosphoribosylamino)uracil reductase